MTFEDEREVLARVTHTWRDHGIDGTPLGERPICNCYDYADAVLATLQAAKAAAWEEGVLWAIEECGVSGPFIAPGENPYDGGGR